MPASPPSPGTGARDSRQPPQLFISYRRADTRHLAGRLSDRLEERFPGAQVFMDVDTIEPGADFAVSIQEAVSRCDVLIAMIGRTWLTLEDHHGRRRIDCPDDYVALEIATALARGVPVIPLLVDEAAMPRPDELPDRLKLLSRRNAARLDHETFRTDIQRILSAVERAIHRPYRPPAVVPGAAPRHEPQQSGPPPRPRPIVQPRAVPAPQSSRPLSTPAVSQESAPSPPPARPPLNQRPIPIYRVALRIGLWWVAVTIGVTICFGLTFEIVASTGNTSGAVIGLLLLAGLLALAIWFLRREVLAQRALLDRAGVDQEHPARRPLSPGHLRRVLISCGAAYIILTMLIVISPPAPAPQTQVPTRTDSR